MKKKHFIIFTSILFCFVVVAILVLRDTNDHKQCGEKVSYELNSKGEKVRITHHICKEKFNL